jgi:hypothetical protein
MKKENKNREKICVTSSAPAMGTSRPPVAGYAVPSKNTLREARDRGWVGRHTCLGDADEDLTYSMETLTPNEPELAQSDNIQGAAGTHASYAARAQKGLIQTDTVAYQEIMSEWENSHCALSEEEKARRARIRQQVAGSADKECGICLERVMVKSKEFGLLDGCAHVYCLACIREWRSVTDLDKQVKRSCPLCREVSHMVIPSSYVPDCEESKQEVVSSYRRRVAQIPCKYFAQGDGDCPFGTSCMYLHQYRDGTIQRYEAPRLRMVSVQSHLISDTVLLMVMIFCVCVCVCVHLRACICKCM